MSTLKTNTITTVDGTGSLTVDRPLAGDGNALVGISPRSFIIDGDFTIFPEGNITAIANSAYGAALWENFDVGGELVHDVDQLADAPTVGQSKHSSTYCMSIDVTTAESAVAAGDFQVIEYKVTGSDFAQLHQQQVTLSFWHKHTKTGTFCGYFMNSAENRSYVYEYTQSSADTWEQHTETLTLDTSGTWLLTEADIGLRVGFCMYGGSTFQGTADSWEGAKDYCTSNQVAGADSASNFCKFSQVGLYLGGSAPIFTSPPISTVVDQVGYYVEELLGGDADQIIGTGLFVSTTLLRVSVPFKKKRVVPTITNDGTGSNYAVIWQSSESLATNTFTLTNIGPTGFDFRTTLSGATSTAGYAGVARSNNASAYILIDARH